MTNQQLIDDFGKYIETKLNARNKVAKEKGADNNLVAFLDREISFLESMELLLVNNIIECERKIAEVKKASFQLGIQSGMLEYRTGRPHPEYLFK